MHHFCLRVSSMPLIDFRKLPKIGTLVRYNGDLKTMQFCGKDQEGRVILRDPKSGIKYLVKAEEVRWK